MQLANIICGKRNEEFITPLHIMEALLQYGQGVACNACTVLVNLLQITTCECLQKFYSELPFPPVPEVPEVSSTDRKPHTPQSRNVILEAMAYARDCNHNYVGTEHLLAALIKTAEGGLLDWFNNLGFTVEKYTQQLSIVLGSEIPFPPYIMAQVEQENLSTFLVQMFPDKKVEEISKLVLKMSKITPEQLWQKFSF